MSEVLLSVCMIAKNESERILRAIESVTGIADEVIVGDTGSTDDTKTLAAGTGAVVMDVPWVDSFAEARNSVLSAASGAWVLSLDCDEVVDREELAILRKSLGSPLMKRFKAYEIERRSYVLKEDSLYRVRPCIGEYPAMESGYHSYVSEPNLLLFRRLPDVLWSGAVHESVKRSIESSSDTSLRGYCALPTLVIHNYGRGIRREEKVRQYAPLVQKRVEEDPLDPSSWFYLALHREAQGEPVMAEKAYKKSLALSKTSFGLYGLASFYLRTGRPKQAEVQLVEYLRYHPEEHSGWMMALACALMREDADCLDYYLTAAMKTGVPKKSDLVRFAKYAVGKLKLDDRLEAYGRFLEKLPNE